MDRIYDYNEYLKENYDLIQILNINNQLIRILENETKGNLKELALIMKLPVNKINELELDLLQIVAYEIIKNELEFI